MKHRADTIRWFTEHDSALANQYERAFVSDVLAHMPELNINSVTPQRGFLDSDGRQRFCDFVIEEGEHVRIAIEIDGFDKLGRGHGMSHTEFLDWQRRHAALVSQGWNVIRFANSDVKNKPATCIKLLSRLLRHERNNSEHIRSLSDSVRGLEIELQSAPTARDLSGIRAKIEELQKLISDAQGPAPVEPQQAEDILIVRRSEQSFPTESIDRKKEQRRQWPLSLFFMAIASLLATFFLVSGKDAPNAALIAPGIEAGPTSSADNSTPTATTTNTRLTNGDSCVDDGSWKTAQERIGTRSFLAGPVHRITYGEDVKGRPTWIEIGDTGRSDDRLTVLIWGNHRERFLPHINDIQPGEVVCASGVVSEYNGRPQVIVKQASQLAVGAP